MGIISAVLGLLCPKRCVFCRRFTDDGAEICQDCAASLPYTGQSYNTPGEFFKECISPLYYSGKAAEAVKRYKFSGKVSYSRLMGRMIGESVKLHGLGGYELVTWVPVSFRRLRRRGYSQARLLAREAAGVLGVKCERLITKRRHTPPQSGLKNFSQRRANVSGAFTAVNERDIAGRGILIIDDIVTTGATFSECARVLLMAGARSVSCAALCRSRKNGGNEIRSGR